MAYPRGEVERAEGLFGVEDHGAHTHKHEGLAVPTQRVLRAQRTAEWGQQWNRSQCRPHIQLQWLVLVRASDVTRLTCRR